MAIVFIQEQSTNWEVDELVERSNADDASTLPDGGDSITLIRESTGGVCIGDQHRRQLGPHQNIPNNW